MCLIPHAPGGDVLIVDDDVVIVEVIADALTIEGYRVRRVFNGVEGLMAIAAAQPALVLLDIQMPYLNGAEVLTQVRQAHPDLPIVLITARPDLALPLLEPYHVACLAKPFELDHLLACVAGYVGRARLANEASRS